MNENKYIEVGGRLHSIATGNILLGANEVFDDDKNKKQNDINTETYSLVNNINERLNSLSPDQQSALNVATKATNNETKLGYYVCDTENNVAAKVISNATGYILSNGGSIKIKMTNANTANDATLNINSTGPKPLYYDGERVSANNSWEAGETVEIYYDGTSYYANNVAGGGIGDGVFDVSVKYPTSGIEGGNTYTLQGALAVLNDNLSANKKKGGMSIKFVQSSDNKYVQYRLKAASWSTTESDWVNVESEISQLDQDLSINGIDFSTISNAANIGKLAGVLDFRVWTDIEGTELMFMGVLFQEGTLFFGVKLETDYVDSFSVGSSPTGIKEYRRNITSVGKRVSFYARIDWDKYLASDTHLWSGNTGLFLNNNAIGTAGWIGVFSGLENGLTMSENNILPTKIIKNSVQKSAVDVAQVAMLSLVYPYIVECKVWSDYSGGIMLLGVLYQDNEIYFGLVDATSHSTIFQTNIHSSDAPTGIKEYNITGTSDDKDFFLHFVIDWDLYSVGYNWTTNSGIILTNNKIAKNGWEAYFGELKQSPGNSELYGISQKALTKDVYPIKEIANAANKSYSNTASGGSFDWLWASATNKMFYIGVKKAFDKDIILKSIHLYLFSDGYAYSNNDVFTLYCGIIDQRGLFLPTKQFSSVNVERNVNDYTITFEENIIPAGQYLAIGYIVKTSTSASVGIRKNTGNTYDETFYAQNDLSNAVTVLAQSSALQYWDIEYTEVDSIFTYKETTDGIKKDINALNDRVNSSSILTDRVTGDKYRLKVSNGQLILSPMVYSTILYIGNSFTQHAISEGLWFALRAMAASVDATQYEELVKAKYGGTYGIKPGFNFETSYNTINIANEFGNLGNYDAIVVQLGENAVYSDTMQAKWAELYAYLKSTYPNSDIYAIIGQVPGDRATAIMNAAASENIPIIDLTGSNAGSSFEGRFRLGDYVTDANGDYEYIRNGGVCYHPSDVGELNIANAILDMFGSERITDKLYGININSASGGELSPTYNAWVAGGIVSIKCIPDEGKVIDSITVKDSSNNSISATKRTNPYGTFYTFVMPYSNVDITPVWADE